MPLGMLTPYYPDFIVKIGASVYLVETKAQKDLKDPNVRQKELGAIDRLKKINELKSEDRMGCEWSYALLGETTFYSMRRVGRVWSTPMTRSASREIRKSGQALLFCLARAKKQTHKGCVGYGCIL